MELKKGQKVWVNLNRGRSSKIVETTIKSIGPKYITVEANDRIKFSRDSLSQVNAIGVASYIILDINKYNKEQCHKNALDTLKVFNWSVLEDEDLDKVYEIIKEYL